MDDFRAPPQENIAGIVIAIESGLVNVERTKKRLIAELDFVRGVCTHLEIEVLYPVDRWPINQCIICGKRWVDEF